MIRFSGFSFLVKSDRELSKPDLIAIENMLKIDNIKSGDQFLRITH